MDKEVNKKGMIERGVSGHPNVKNKKLRRYKA